MKANPFQYELKKRFFYLFRQTVDLEFLDTPLSAMLLNFKKCLTEITGTLCLFKSYFEYPTAMVKSQSF